MLLQASQDLTYTLAHASAVFYKCRDNVYLAMSTRIAIGGVSISAQLIAHTDPLVSCKHKTIKGTLISIPPARTLCILTV